MGTDEVGGLAAADAGEPTETASLPTDNAVETARPTGNPAEPDTEPTPKPGWTRRAFFQAAALGAAAAAFLDGKHFGSIAWANDLSTFPCTANDIDVGTGTVVNEPCIPCTGTFDANVTFPVTNSTGSDNRVCVTLHLPGGFGVPEQDVVLGGGALVPANSTVNMTGTVTGFPCNPSGLVCIGIPLAVTFKGKCAAGQCASVSFNTAGGNAPCPDTNPPHGQCRHEQICIQGYGASLKCGFTGTDCTTGSTSCAVNCGASASLLACVNGGASPYVYTLLGSDGSSQTYPSTGTTTDTSHIFTNVTPPAGSTTYTLTVTDSNGCKRTATATLTTAAIATPTLSAGTPDCTGTVAYSVTNCDTKLTYTFKEVKCSDGSLIGILTGNNGGCSLSHTFPQDDADHCVTVTASNGTASCDQTSLPAKVHINPVPTVTAPTATNACVAAATETTVHFTASASSCVGTSSFQWYVDATDPTHPDAAHKVKDSADAFYDYPNNPDNTSHKVTVTVTCSGCTSAPATKAILQCVSRQIS